MNPIEHETRETTSLESLTLANGDEIEVRCRWEITLAKFEQSHGPGLIEPTTEQERAELVHWEASPVPDGHNGEVAKLILKHAPDWAENVEL